MFNGIGCDWALMGRLWEIQQQAAVAVARVPHWVISSAAPGLIGADTLMSGAGAWSALLNLTLRPHSLHTHTHTHTATTTKAPHCFSRLRSPSSQHGWALWFLSSAGFKWIQRFVLHCKLQSVRGTLDFPQRACVSGCACVFACLDACVCACCSGGTRTVGFTQGSRCWKRFRTVSGSCLHNKEEWVWWWWWWWWW